LFKLVLEPEWEAKFEDNSYGFRPGRNCHDAIKAILFSIQKRSKYVLDADIKKCFDKIDHKALLAKLNLKGKMHQQIKSWLKAGIIDNNVFSKTEEGTPQVRRGVISPLLANIALHGMENMLKEYVSTVPLIYPSGKKMNKEDKISSISIIRYADDFVVMHYDKEVILECKRLLNKWLFNMGLTLSEEKTSITHTLNLSSSEQIEFAKKSPGFNFLDFTVRQFYTKYKSAYNKFKPLGYRTLVYPSKEKCNEHCRSLSKVVRSHNSKSQSLLIGKLNEKIAGWARYFGCSDASTLKILQKLDYLLYLKLRRWAKRNTGTAKLGLIKYWHPHDDRKWVFCVPSEKLYLLNYLSFSAPINGYVKVHSERSPFDENGKYWASRLGTNPTLPTSLVKLLKLQKGKCKLCNLTFSEDDVIETDHIIPLSQGGKDMYNNLQLLHRHCHDTKTALDLKKYS
jgi:RNA-directed DNA polymerase